MFMCSNVSGEVVMSLSLFHESDEDIRGSQNMVEWFSNEEMWSITALALNGRQFVHVSNVNKGYYNNNIKAAGEIE